MNLDQARTLLRAGDARLARTDDGTWIACVSLETQDGPIRLCASATEATLRGLLARRALAMQARAAGTDAELESATAGAFSMRSIAQAARKLARARAIRRLMATADRVLQDRRVRGIMGIVKFIPVYGQAANLAYTRARAAARVVHQYQQGHPETQRRVQQVAQAAARGVPAAQDALRTLHGAWQGYQQIHGRAAAPARPGPSTTQTSSGGMLGSARARGIASLARLNH